MEPRHFVSVVQRFLSGDLVRQHGVVCKFDILGEGGGVFYLDLKNGEISVLFSFEKCEIVTKMISSTTINGSCTLRDISRDKVKCSGGSKWGGDARDGHPPPPTDPKFLHFHAVFRKTWPNNRLAPPPLWGWRRLLWEILDPRLKWIRKMNL